MTGMLSKYVSSTVTLTGSPTGRYSYSPTLTITNRAGIGFAAYGAQDGVYDNSAVAASGYTLINHGSIDAGASQTGAGGVGVHMLVAGSISNAGGYISGGYSVSGTGGIGVMTAGGNVAASSTGTHYAPNAGAIYGGNSDTGTGGIAVDMTAGGALKNSGLSLIAGGDSMTAGGGIGIDMAAGGSVTNTGKYAYVLGGQTSAAGAVGGTGVVMNGGSITNAGHIEGGYGNVAGAMGGTGLVENGLATVSNSGTIVGGAGIAPLTQGVGVIINSGSLTNSSTGSIESGYYVLTTNSSGKSVHTTIYDAVATKVYTGGTLTNSGKVYGGSVGVDIYGGTVINSGMLTSYKSTPVTTIPHDTAVNFGSVAGGLLELEVAVNGISTAGIYGNISGFVKGDTVEIANMMPTAAQAAFNTTTDTLVDNGNIVFAPAYAGEQFNFTADGSGTDITSAACYRMGTRIRTKTGDVPIEELAIGDKLTTVSGVVRPIRWIGRIRHARRFAAGNQDVLPIKICAGALAHDVPVRDLWVSPDHAMLVDAMLIPARSLVNGLTIWQDETPSDVAYIHVEFDTHDLIYAEGAASETYVDDDTRAMFDNAEDYTLRYPAASSVAPVLCAPRVEEGYHVEMVRDRLRARAEKMSLNMVNEVSRRRAPIYAHGTNRRESYDRIQGPDGGDRSRGRAADPSAGHCQSRQW